MIAIAEAGGMKTKMKNIVDSDVKTRISLCFFGTNGK
jgi:hypothetical protein